MITIQTHTLHVWLGTLHLIHLLASGEEVNFFATAAHVLDEKQEDGHKA